MESPGDDGPAGGEFVQSQQQAVKRLSRGYALGTMLLIAIVIAGALVARGSVESLSGDVEHINTAGDLLVSAAEALILLRSLQVSPPRSRGCTRVCDDVALSQIFAFLSSSSDSTIWASRLASSRADLRALAVSWERSTEEVFQGISDSSLMASWEVQRVPSATAVRLRVCACVRGHCGFGGHALRRWLPSPRRYQVSLPGTRRGT